MRSALPMDVYAIIIDLVLASCAERPVERKAALFNLERVSRGWYHAVFSRRELVVLSLPQLIRLGRDVQYWRDDRKPRRLTLAFSVADLDAGERKALCRARKLVKNNLPDLEVLELVGLVEWDPMVKVWDPKGRVRHLRKLVLATAMCTCGQHSYWYHKVDLTDCLEWPCPNLQSIDVRHGLVASIGRRIRKPPTLTEVKVANLQIDYIQERPSLHLASLLSQSHSSLRTLLSGRQPFTVPQLVALLIPLEHLSDVKLTEYVHPSDAAEHTILWTALGAKLHLHSLSVGNYFLTPLFDTMELLPQHRHLPFTKPFPALRTLDITPPSIDATAPHSPELLLAHILGRLKSGRYEEVRTEIRVAGLVPKTMLGGLEVKVRVLRKRYGVRITIEGQGDVLQCIRL